MIHEDCSKPADLIGSAWNGRERYTTEGDGRDLDHPLNDTDLVQSERVAPPAHSYCGEHHPKR